MARNAESAGVDAAMELIMREGFEGLGEADRTLIDEAMRLERSRHLGAGPWGRAEARQGHANRRSGHDSASARSPSHRCATAAFT